MMFIPIAVVLPLAKLAAGSMIVWPLIAPMVILFALNLIMAITAIDELVVAHLSSGRTFEQNIGLDNDSSNAPSRKSPSSLGIGSSIFTNSSENVTHSTINTEQRNTTGEQDTIWNGGSSSPTTSQPFDTDPTPVDGEETPSTAELTEAQRERIRIMELPKDDPERELYLIT